MDTDTVRTEVGKPVTVQRRVLLAVFLLGILIGLGVAGGIRGCELKHDRPTAVATP